MSIETTILQNLLSNETYGRKVLPFLKAEYFHNTYEKELYTLTESYILKYNKFPSKEALLIDLENKSGLSQDCYDTVKNQIKDLSLDSINDIHWLLDTTEQFCQEKALYNAVMQSIKIIDGKDTKLSKGDMPEILSKALAVSFDTNIGHDFIEDWERLYDSFHIKENRLPFNIEYLDTITDGGLTSGTLTCILAPSGVGKSLVMCSMASNNLNQAKNVLYITLEMSENKIAERIAANILDVDIKSLRTLSKDDYKKKIDLAKNKAGNGRLIIKAYPPGSANANHFRHLLEELKLKQNFIPDIIYFDYLSICSSARLKMAQTNSYGYVKAIAEELRGLAIEYNIPGVTACQINREGLSSTDVESSNISDSVGLLYTVDLLLAVVQPEELAEAGQYLFKQLKNRYNDLNYYKKFLVGVDKSKMKLFNIQNEEKVSQGTLRTSNDAKTKFNDWS